MNIKDLLVGRAQKRRTLAFMDVQKRGNAQNGKKTNQHASGKGQQILTRVEMGEGRQVPINEGMETSKNFKT